MKVEKSKVKVSYLRIIYTHDILFSSRPAPVILRCNFVTPEPSAMLDETSFIRTLGKCAYGLCLRTTEETHVSSRCTFGTPDLPASMQSDYATPTALLLPRKQLFSKILLNKDEYFLPFFHATALWHPCYFTTCA